MPPGLTRRADWKSASEGHPSGQYVRVPRDAVALTSEAAGMPLDVVPAGGMTHGTMFLQY